MNRCLQCSKEIPEGRKFCSSSCSAKYNNVRRQRKPWTEEQKSRVRVERVQQVCRFCGKTTGRVVRKGLYSQTSICPECKPYWRENLYKHLNLQEGTLQDRFLKAFNLVSQLYFEDRLSAVEIGKQLGIHEHTVRNILQRGGSALRTPREAQQLVVEQGIRPIFNNNQYKSGWYETWEGKKIFYRSSWELEYAIQLDEQQVSYDVEDLKIKYFDTQKGEERIAIPDFHLLSTNEIVEIKSSWTYDEQLMKDKFKAYREAGYKPRLILNKKEIVL